MLLFQSLARAGKAVVCITHFPDRLRMCDRLLYLMNGKVVFQGTPQEMTAFFGVDTIEAVYTKQREKGADEWTASYRAKFKKPNIPAAGGHLPEDIPDATDVTQQWTTLFMRYFRLQIADWKNCLLLFAQAPIIAVMIGIAFGNITAEFAELHASRIKEVIFTMVLSVLWCAGTASVREVVKEFSILRHESRFGVKIIPYLASKFILLSILTTIQAALLLLVVKRMTGLIGPFEIQLLVLAFTSFAGIALGLFISTVSGTSERAMTVLPIVLIAQAIFSGGLAQLEGLVKIFAQCTMPAYWALDGLRSTFHAEIKMATYPGAPGHYQPPILGQGGPFYIDLAILSVMTVVFLALAFVVLRMIMSGKTSMLQRLIQRVRAVVSR